ncbi:MAG: DNA-processing protein DprA [Anaerolineales bacterium]|nr:DNA-processing protein DprA [Anaerolineales bacterium]
MPTKLLSRFEPPLPFTYIGNRKLLSLSSTALLCSLKYTGESVLNAYDIAVNLREKKTPVIGGFHSPVEKDMLRVLWRGSQPITIVLARSLENMRLPRAYRQPLEEGRLLLLSPFAEGRPRPTKEMSAYRNLVVGALAEKILIIHASPGGMLEAQCAQFLEWGKPVYTLAHEANARLIEQGVKPICSLNDL